VTPRPGKASGRRRRIFSVYLTENEEDRILTVARTNGTSVNFVMRCAVRGLLGMPTPHLTTGEDDDELEPEQRAASGD
jgi:hypothetical protein